MPGTLSDPFPRHVIFCCTANRIRSVFAERTALQLRLAPGWLKETPITSRGILAIEPAPAMPEAIRTARLFGVDLKKHTARTLTSADLKDAWLIAMTQSHLDALRPDQDVCWRINLLGDFSDCGNIDDPVGLPESEYIPVFEKILSSLQSWSHCPHSDVRALN